MDWRSAATRHASKCIKAVVAFGLQNNNKAHSVQTSDHPQTFQSSPTNFFSPFPAVVPEFNAFGERVPLQLCGNRRVCPSPQFESSDSDTESVEPACNRSFNPRPTQVGRQQGSKGIKEASTGKMTFNVQPDVKKWRLSNVELAKIQEPP